MSKDAASRAANGSRPPRTEKPAVHGEKHPADCGICEASNREKPIEPKNDIRQKAENTDTAADGCCVYILRCADGTLYTGWTNDLSSRVAAHNAGKGAKYTRGRLPARLVYSERAADKGEALRREYALKQLTREEKERLIVENNGDVHKSLENSGETL